RRAPRSRSCTSRSARTATPSTRASRSSWIRGAGWSASSAGLSALGSRADRRHMTVGGQAVLEGVMMRSPSSWAVAVRKPNGEIAEVTNSITSAMARHRVLRLPVIRGVVALGESLAIGFRALAISANYAAQDADAETDEEVSHELSRGALAFAFFVAIGFAVMLFKV